jgi:hypothetical protein
MSGPYTLKTEFSASDRDVRRVLQRIVRRAAAQHGVAGVPEIEQPTVERLLAQFGPQLFRLTRDQLAQLVSLTPYPPRPRPRVRT